MTARPSWIITVRADQWWTFKLLPPVIAFYAVKLRAGVPIVTYWADLIAVLVALGSGAAAISLINDAFDRADDKAAGKTNRLEQAGPVRIALLLAPHALVAAFMILWWRGQPLTLLLYIATWMSFLFYSVPPVRLKRRGFAGAVADATGASLLPVLLAASVGTGGRVDTSLLIVLGFWSLAYGIRGIVWHQIEDIENDRRSGIATYVMQAGPEHARRMVRRFVFPAEVFTLLVLIALLQSVALALALCLYLRTIGPMKGHYGRRPTVIAEDPLTVPLLFDYYTAILPIILLVESTALHPEDAIAIGLHLVLFSSAWLPYTSEFWHWRKR